MNLTETGCLLSQNQIHSDDRGFFLETFRHDKFSANFYEGATPHFVQENVSISNRGVVRGLHFQTKKPQGKLVRVLTGAVIDFVIDLRVGSKTYGMSENFLLHSPGISLYVPPGFAHGFWSLANNTVFSYKCTDYYDPSGESGINPLDKELNAPWYSVRDELTIAPKDLAFKTLREYLDGSKT